MESTITKEDMKFLREEVTVGDIAEIISRWTGIPVTRLQQSEREKLLRFVGACCGKNLLALKQS